MTNSKEKTLHRISKLKSIESKKLYTYSLTHVYDTTNTPLVFSVHIAPSVIRPLIAYIEFIYEECGDESWSIGKDVIVNVINEIYSKVNYKNINSIIHKVDQYYNREYWCGSRLATKYDVFTNIELLPLVTDLVNAEIKAYNEKEAVASNI